MVRQKRRQFILAVEFRDSIEFRLQWCKPLVVDRILVHTGSVVVADFLFVGATIGAAFGRFFQHHVEYTLVVFRDHRARAKSRSVVRNGIQFAEISACILREIRAWVGRRVDELFVQSRQTFVGLLSVRRSLALRLCHEGRANRRCYQCPCRECCPSSSHRHISFRWHRALAGCQQHSSRSLQVAVLETRTPTPSSASRGFIPVFRRTRILSLRPDSHLDLSIYHRPARSRTRRRLRLPWDYFRFVGLTGSHREPCVIASRAELLFMTLNQASPAQSLVASLFASPTNGAGHDKTTLAICEKAAEQGLLTCATRPGTTLRRSPGWTEGPGAGLYVVPDRR